MRRGQQHILEMAKDIRTDGVTFETGEVEAILTFPVIDIEVVYPEINEDFFQLAVGIDCTVVGYRIRSMNAVLSRGGRELA